MLWRPCSSLPLSASLLPALAAFIDESQLVPRAVFLGCSLSLSQLGFSFKLTARQGFKYKLFFYLIWKVRGMSSLSSSAFFLHLHLFLPFLPAPHSVSHSLYLLLTFHSCLLHIPIFCPLFSTSLSFHCLSIYLPHTCTCSLLHTLIPSLTHTPTEL